MSKTATAPAAKHRRRTAAARVLGSKGGEAKPYTPYKAPDSALSVATVKLLYALSEGPIVGPVDGRRSIKLNGTPLISPDGSENFPGTIWDFRSGTVDQEHIAGFPAIESEASQGLPVELKSDNAWTHAITDQQLSAVRVRLSWPQIWQVKTNGDQIGYRIDYAIDLSVNGGSYQTVLSATLNDKGTTEYERTHRIDLPEGFTSALVRVRRLTPNRNDSNFADLMRIKGLTEVIDKKLRYPNLALGGLQFDAKQFQDTPKASFLMRGRIVQVPSNYDPQTRTYTGDWNGTFKLAYTNNPVWIWRDLLLHRRYGLGRRITADMVDHWTLYEIGRYCDVMVPDGKGGVQPRMTTNVYIQDSIEGYALLSDLASVFRGSSCWNGSQVTMVADIPGNEDGYVFTRSNIVGEFEYVAAAYPDRHTRAKVAWDNPENEFKTQPAPVTNDELIGVLGHRMLDISRFGCTVEGEAIRHGIWALKSEQYEEWSVSFTTGMEGRNVEPGQIICVADELFSGRANGGRIRAATKRVITLDIDAEVHEEDRLILNLPSGKSEGRIVKSVSGRMVTVMADYSELPEAECSWSVESADLAVMRFRVQTIEPQGLHQFKIAATQHEPLKYEAIDTGARIDPQPTSVIPPGVMSPPANIGIEARSVVSQGISVTSMRITWDSVAGAIAYNVEWRKDSGNWIRLPRTGNLGADVEGIYSGRYVARVSSVNAMDVTSIWGASQEVVLTGKVGLPPAVAFLTTTSELFGIGIKWGFPAGAEDTQRTELWYGPANDLSVATKLADLAYPQADYRMQSLLAGASFFFWARLVDRTGNIGPFYPVVNGVIGQASSQAGPILDLIAGQIGDTELAKEIMDQIDLISGSGPGSVNDRLEQAKQELEDLIDQVTDALAYDPAKPYTVGQIVRQGQYLYQAIKAVPVDTPPPAAEFWFNMGTIAETTQAMALQIQQNKASIETVDGKVTAQASALQSLQASWREDDGEGDLAGALQNWDAAAKFAQQVKVQASDNLAMVERTTSLDAAVGQNKAALTTLEQVVATDQVVTAERIDQLKGEVDDNSAAVQTVSQSLVDTSTAIASHSTTLEAIAGGGRDGTDEGDLASALSEWKNKAAIQITAKAQADADGKLSTMWAVKMQVNQNGQYVAAGIGLGIEQNAEGLLQSQFLVSADRFAVVNTLAGGTITTPFVVSGGQVFMNSAFIQDGTITMLKIGQALQSDNYVEGIQGWRLDKAGNLEFNGPAPGGGRLSMTNRAIKVYDANNVKRVQLGDLSV
ncbi:MULTISPECIES: phage tail protein [unclassified Pseudomonas]|uniref:phage tail protein n=1 Tax=unclassified Pseudomonas TaxID=196821 RepID=UPI001865C66F|nr:MULTISPECIES: phage tail protein [unclassified Pseudomonas]